MKVFMYSLYTIDVLSLVHKRENSFDSKNILKFRRRFNGYDFCLKLIFSHKISHGFQAKFKENKAPADKIRLFFFEKKSNFKKK